MGAEDHDDDRVPARYLDAVEAGARACSTRRCTATSGRAPATGSPRPRRPAAWDRFRFVPRVLHDVTEVDLATELLGTRLATPVRGRPDDPAARGRPRGRGGDGPRRRGRRLRCSWSRATPGRRSRTSPPTGVDWWLQMYVTADRVRHAARSSSAPSRRARAAIVLTADTPVVGTKYDDGAPVWDAVDPAWLRVNFAGPAASDAAGEKATDLGPQDIAWLAAPLRPARSWSRGSCTRPTRGGASTPGPRRSGSPTTGAASSTARWRPRTSSGGVAAEVGDDAEVYVDGGVRRGSDALAAAALGARAVFLGRPPLFALACDGEPGVRRVLAELGEELEESLRLAGCTSLGARITRPAPGAGDAPDPEPRKACEPPHPPPI